MTNQENNQPEATLEDLSLAEINQEEIKGGPAYMKLGDIKGESQLAPQTREHILLARQTV